MTTSNENILVVDIGTSSMRGIVYDQNANVLNSVQICYSPDYVTPERVEQNPLNWKNNLINIVKEQTEFCNQKNVKIAAVSVTSQRSSLIAVDDKGNPLCNAIMWQDKRVLPICSEINKYDKLVYSLAGSKINPVFTAPKITWLKNNSSDIYAKTYKTLVIPDYVNFIMTGEFKTDHTYGSRSLLMNLKDRKWDKQLLSIFDADEEKLCELISPGSIIGYITNEFSKLTGIAEGTPVITAGGDQQCAALGLGVTSQGSAEITAGTGAYIIASADTLPSLTESDIICNASAIPGKYVLEASILTCSSVYNWFNKNFYETNDQCNYMADINADVSLSQVGSNGVFSPSILSGAWNSGLEWKCKGNFCKCNS